MKEVYSITELSELGYPFNLIKKLVKSEDFSEIGFRVSNKKNSKAYFFKTKLDRYLMERETK